MNTKIKHPIAVVAVTAATLIFSSLSQANTPQKLNPGLWEITIDGAKENIGTPYVNRLQQKMDKLPDFLREKLQSMIGRHKEIIGGQNKYCITKDQFTAAPVSAMGPRGCTEKVVWDDLSGAGTAYLNCPDGSKGQGHITVLGSKRFQMMLKLRGGAAAKGNQKFVGKFIGQDCGTIKPR